MNLTATPLVSTGRCTRLDHPDDAVAADEPMPTLERPVGLVSNGLTLNGLTLTVADVDEPELTTFARCADGHGTLSHLFFSDDDFDLARAKAICRSCGLRRSCLAGAIERAEPYGVWGGKLVLDGVPVEVKRKRGRPPRTPRPVLVVDEAPLPPHLVA